MSERVAIDENSVPRFQPHMKLRFDKRRDRWVVLAPERLFVPDEIALEILRRCDGVATVTAIVDDLARMSGAPRAEIMGDVSALLQELTDKGVLAA